MKTITFHQPSKTLPITVTGKKCALNCRHCGGFYLQSMKTLSDVMNITDDIPTGFLISGGCDEGGAVPLWQYLDDLKKLKKAGFKLNIHTGMIPLEKIPAIAPLADVISFDFITHDKTIREVYGSKKAVGPVEKWITGDDYIQTYLELKKYAPVVPHITIGLLGGKIEGEYDALETLYKIGTEKIVFLVFMPTRGTFYENNLPPAIFEVEKLVSFAHQLFPSASLGIGCMHPRGKYKFDLEMLGYKYNFDSFVNPSGRFRRFIQEISEKDNEIEIVIKKECCAFC